MALAKGYGVHLVASLADVQAGAVQGLDCVFTDLQPGKRPRKPGDLPGVLSSAVYALGHGTLAYPATLARDRLFTYAGRVVCGVQRDLLGSHQPPDVSRAVSYGDVCLCD